MRRRIPVALLLAALLWSAAPNVLMAHADTLLPGAPTNVSAQAGTLSATVQWTPADSQATSYTVKSSPRGITATVDGTATTATVTGLAFATRYTFTVSGTNGIGTGPASAPSNGVTPGAPGGPYHQGAARVLTDTDVTAGAAVMFNIGEDRVHAPGISAVVLNLTASAATQALAVQLVVRDQVAATVSVSPGVVESSLSIVPVADQMNPAIVQATTGQVHVEIDFVGFFTDARTVRDNSGLLQIIQTTTVLDATVAAGTSTDIAMLGQGDVPASGVAGVLLNVTAINPGGTGSFELMPASTLDPGTTTLGFVGGATASDRAIVPLPASGLVTLLARDAGAEARIDVLGWFTDGSDNSAVGALYTPVNATRLIETQASAGALVTFPVWGQGGTPNGSNPAPATSAVVQVTVTSPDGSGSIVMSGTSILSFGAGQMAAGTTVEPLQAPGGMASLQVTGAPAHVTVDLIGFLSGDLIVPGSTKVLTSDQLAGITDLTATSITFAPGTLVSPPVRLNDVINAGQSAATPDGLLRRVLSVSTLADGSTFLGTRTASVPEAITSFFLHWTLGPAPAAFGMGHNAPARPVAAPALNTNPLPPPANTSLDPKSPWPILAVAKPPVGAMLDLSTDNKDGFQSGSEIDLTELEFQARINALWSLSPDGTFKFHIGFGVGVRGSLEVQALGQISPIDLKNLMPFSFVLGPPVFIYLGGVFWLEFQPRADFRVEFRVSITVGLVIHLGIDRYLEISGGYDGTKFFADPPTFRNYLTPAQEFNWRPAEQLEAEIDLHVRPGLHFYGGIGVFGIDIWPFARGTVDPTASHWWDLTFGLCGALEFFVDLVFSVGDFEGPPICVTLTALEAPGPLLGITITPSPATVHRSQTQHFHAEIPLSVNGVVWSIKETGGGTLNNAKPFDVDYTAPKTAGTYHLRAEAVDDPTSANEITITVPPDPPAAPTNVVAALTTSTSAIVGWTAPTDDGGAPLTVYKVTVSPGGAFFSINAPQTTATVSQLNPGTTYTFAVTATNAANLTSPASAASNSITTPPAGPMSVAPTSLTFGSVTLGQSSQPQTVLVTAGGAQLVISTISLVGVNPGEFAIQNDTCSGQTLQPGGSCSFAVQYAPTQQISASATVSISDSDATSPQTVTLSGSSPVPAVSGVLPVNDIQMIDSQTGYALEAAIGSAVLKTTDGGKTWNTLLLPPFDQVLGTFNGYSLRFIDANHGFITAFRRLNVGQVDFILATSDGGQSWQQINIPAGVAPASMWFTDATHGWIVTGVAGPPAPPGSLNSSNLLAVFATTDGGLTWTRHDLPDPIIAGTPGCIGVEGNGGASFTDALNGWVSGATICFAPNGTITTQGVLFWTTNDGGTTWTAHQASGVLSIGARIQVTGTTQVRQLGVVKVSSTSVEQVLVSSNDGGATFTVTQLPAQNGQPPAVTFSDSVHGIFVTSDGQVWRTTDGGVTWQGSALPKFASSAGRITQYNYRAVASPDGTNIWITGAVSYGFTQAGFIEISSDGGATWTVQLLGSGA